ncbi:hypothetical protein CPB97_011635 [Podila verticillata]|nr:hypothetical protein CPB97_011635 [Podila verticillata]
MNLHALLGHKPGSINIVSLLTEATKRANISGCIVPEPDVKIYKDAVYYSYLPLGVSFNFEPPTPLSTARNAPKPDPSLLSLVAIHLYSHPTDKFATFPLSFTVSIQPSQESTVTMVELDMTKKAHEVVSLLGEPEKKEGGGRAGNCWIGYQSSLGVSCDLRGADWEDRNMALGCVTISAPAK